MLRSMPVGWLAAFLGVVGCLYFLHISVVNSFVCPRSSPVVGGGRFFEMYDLFLLGLLLS